MTLLANEAGKESSAILSKYKIPKAKNHHDLEVKLAELYFGKNTDKLQLEKELADIHPHKDWLIRTLELNTPEQIEKIKLELTDAQKKDEETKEKCVDDDCEIHGKNAQMSSFSGQSDSSSERKISNSMEVIGLVGVVGLIGLTFIIVSKNLK